MKRLLRRVLSLLANLSRPTGLVHAAGQSLLSLDSAPSWEPEHQRVLAQFLSGPAGRVFSARARAMQADMAIRACSDPFSTTHSVGQANGFGEALKWIDSLSRSSRANEEGTPAQLAAEQANHDTLPPGATELRERLAP